MRESLARLLHAWLCDGAEEWSMLDMEAREYFCDFADDVLSLIFTLGIEKHLNTFDDVSSFLTGYCCNMSGVRLGTRLNEAVEELSGTFVTRSETDVVA